MTNRNKDKIFSIIMTTVFHAIIVIILCFMCFRTPLPLPSEAGVEVNLGMYESGKGDESDERSYEEKKEETKVEERIDNIVENVDNNIEEENIINSDTETPTIETEKPEEIKEEQPTVNQRAMFQMPQKNDNSSSQGNTKQDGIQGNPNGLKDMNRYEGNPGSGGTIYDLGGRGAKSISSPSKDFKDEGKVVVDIWVDKDGKVIKAEIGKGTTLSDISMQESARQAALRSIFDEDHNTTELQRGTITYTFIIRQ